MTIHPNFIGCDIAKAVIDLFDPRTGKTSHLANEPAVLAAFASGLDPARDILVMEATGSADRLLRHVLAAHAIAFVRVNPTMVRRFAQARGRLAKTDRIDARSLAAFGTMFQPNADPPPDPERERLAALARRRDQLVEARAIERRHLQDAFDPIVRTDIADAIAALDARIAAIETEIEAQARAMRGVQAEIERLVTAPGVGKVTALTLIAHMPELGRLSPKTAASLAGLAPMNDDSGARKGKRRIRGGRPRVRRALYMAALGAVRASTPLRAFYTALAARAASKKLALIAVARKLLTILNAMIRDKKTYA
jgi:transposase